MIEGKREVDTLFECLYKDNESSIGIFADKNENLYELTFDICRGEFCGWQTFSLGNKELNEFIKLSEHNLQALRGVSSIKDNKTASCISFEFTKNGCLSVYGFLEYNSAKLKLKFELDADQTLLKNLVSYLTHQKII